MFSCRYFMLPCSEKSATVCPSPRRTHLVVRSPSKPTGPLACILAVLIPTSAPAKINCIQSSLLSSFQDTDRLRTMWKKVWHYDTMHTQSKTIAICKARAGIPEYTCAVHLLQKLFSWIFIFCNNNICVGAAVFVDVVHSILHAVYHFNAAFQIPILCAERLHLRWAES